MQAKGRCSVINIFALVCVLHQQGHARKDLHHASLFGKIHGAISATGRRDSSSCRLSKPAGLLVKKTNKGARAVLN